ncbi:uncharacterized protein [Ptychodera flava]|uniref:uncharacterized protein n=1 Tax=Ptychodera flava TaxID=63121 RepID=UPI00396A4843
MGSPLLIFVFLPAFIFHFGDTTPLMKRDTLCPDNNNYCYRSDICTYLLAFHGSEDSQCPEAENFVTAVNEVVENVELLDYRMDEVEERIEILYYLHERALSIVDQVNDTFVRQRRHIDLLEPIIDSMVNISDTISSLEHRIEGHGNWCREQLERRDIGLRECQHNSTESDRQLRGHREQLAEMSNCPADWHYFNGRCYYVQSNESYSWQEAYDICYDMDGRLVIIQDRQLDDFLRTLRHGNLWIGLSDIRSEGHWEWIDGTPLNYSNWYQNEPNNLQGGEDCGQMRKRMDGQWNDGPCATTCGFICENNKASPNLWFNFRSVGSIPGEDRIQPTDNVMITNQGERGDIALFPILVHSFLVMKMC